MSPEPEPGIWRGFCWSMAFMKCAMWPSWKAHSATVVHVRR